MESIGLIQMTEFCQFIKIVIAVATTYTVEQACDWNGGRIICTNRDGITDLSTFPRYIIVIRWIIKVHGERVLEIINNMDYLVFRGNHRIGIAII